MFKNLLFSLLFIFTLTFNIVAVNAKEIDLRLINAATTGDLKEIRVLIKNGIDINIKDKNHKTALVHASRNGHLEIVKTLLDNKAEILTYDELGNAPLMSASCGGHIEIVKLLLTHDDIVYINHSDYGGNTALTAAIVCAQPEMIDLLIKNGANVNATHDEEGWTPLMIATQNVPIDAVNDVVKQLIKNKADVNIKNSNGWTALMIASNVGRTDAAKLLINNKADINIQDGEGWTALMIAINNNWTDVVKLLIDSGTDVNIQETLQSFTALMIAIGKEKNIEIAKYLINNNADIDLPDKHGGTALMIAVNLDLADVVKLLIDNKADINIKVNNTTALSIATANGHTEIIKLLKKAGAKE